jgi:hypothetical protein
MTAKESQYRNYDAAFEKLFRSTVLTTKDLYMV